MNIRIAKSKADKQSIVVCSHRLFHHGPPQRSVTSANYLSYFWYHGLRCRRIYALLDMGQERACGSLRVRLLSQRTQVWRAIYGHCSETLPRSCKNTWSTAKTTVCGSMRTRTMQTFRIGRPAYYDKTCAATIMIVLRLRRGVWNLPGRISG